VKFLLEVPNDYDMHRLNGKNIMRCDEQKCPYITTDATMLVKHVFQEHYNFSNYNREEGEP
jgi:hypothetical protein